MRDLLGFNAKRLYEEYNFSPNPVDILSFDTIFLECDIVQGIIFKIKDLEIFIVLLWMLILVINTLKNLEVEYNGFFVESKDIISSIFFKFKNEKSQLVSFNGQSITFRLSIRET